MNKPVLIADVFTFADLPKNTQTRVLLPLVSCGMTTERALAEAELYLYTHSGKRFARIMREDLTNR